MSYSAIILALTVVFDHAVSLFFSIYADKRLQKQRNYVPLVMRAGSPQQNITPLQPLKQNQCILGSDWNSTA